jgi:ABC-type multidrug transport system ATPase subunit
VFTLNGRQYSCHEWYTLISGHHFQIGFVPQDDQGVYSEFTVFQNLFWAGRFQLPHQTSNDEVRKLADSVIFSLGLDLVRDTRVGSVHKRGISGGERRRCSIGLSMMAKPHILFLDEPTSGLDASSSTTVITILKKLTKERNLSVLCSIHQPRQKIFSMFNSLIFLGNGGKLVYSGEAKLARPYFERLGFLNDEESNPADFLLDISSGVLARTHHPKEIISDELSVTWKDMMMQFETPAINTTKEVEINKTNGNELRPPAFKQFVFQTQRCFLLMKKSLKVKVMDTLIIISGATLLTLLEGVVVLAHDFNEAPLPFHVLMKVKENPNSIPLKRMWYFSMTPINDWLQ